MCMEAGGSERGEAAGQSLGIHGALDVPSPLGGGLPTSTVQGRKKQGHVASMGKGGHLPPDQCVPRAESQNSLSLQTQGNAHVPNADISAALEETLCATERSLTPSHRGLVV